MKLQQHQQKHIEAWQSSGMSQAAYCREQRLNAKTFGNWLRAYRSGCAVESARFFRRLFSLSQTVSADSSNWQ